MGDYCVYKHTSPTGKVYIGVTSQLVCQRWSRGKGYRNNWHFYNAIQHYGWDSFKHEVLYEHLEREQACKKEIELISQYESTNHEKGYNRSPGGNLHTPFSDESRKKMSESAKRRKTTCKGEKHPQYGLRGELSQNFGRKHSIEERANMRENNTRKIPVCCVETSEIFESAAVAGEQFKIARGSILGCCHGKPHYNTAGGYHWRFADE